jgi:S1-C subfamily serine protease
MPSTGNWQIPPAKQPDRSDFGFDVDAALNAVVGLTSQVPADAFTADTLGTERGGHGVLIRPGIVLTIGYLITEAETIWISAGGRVVPGHALGYDQETGFGLVQALDRIDIDPVPLGSSAGAALGDTVIFAGSGGRRHALVATLVAKQEFAGYWEYVLDEAIFTGPAHPFWGGGAVLDEAGRLIGIGSLQIEHRRPSGETVTLNMVVPIDLLKPILDEMLTTGQVARPKRPWLGVYIAEVDDGFAVIGIAEGGPADSAGIRPGDRVRAVGGVQPESLAALFRAIWASGAAGDRVHLTLERDGKPHEIAVVSSERGRFLKGPKLHS